jgi:hypothetical protein
MRAGQAGLIVLVVEDDALIRCDVVSELYAAVIYTSGNTSDRSRLVRGGVFFNKPCDLGQLADTCHRLCAPHA